MFETVLTSHADGDDLDAPTVQRDESEAERHDNYADEDSEEDFPDFGHAGPGPKQIGARKQHKHGLHAAWDATAFANRPGKTKQRDLW